MRTASLLRFVMEATSVCGQPSDDHHQQHVQADVSQLESPAKKKVLQAEESKRGIVYLSYIPAGINVSVLRQLFGQFGEVNRIYLQPDKQTGFRKNKVKYVEGWCEFAKKKVAKRIAETLNGTQIGGKRRTQFYDSIWSIKYLKKFKWSHLTEQVAYEKALREQRFRLEIGMAKKESDFYTNMTDLQKRIKKKGQDGKETRMRIYKQRLTEEQIKQRKKSLVDEVDMELIQKIFT